MEIMHQKEKIIYGRIAGKSTLANKGIDVSARVIDTDYRGTIYVVLINTCHKEYFVEIGDDIAHIIFEQYYVPQIQLVESSDQLEETERMQSCFSNKENVLALVEEAKVGIPSPFVPVFLSHHFPIFYL